jgi:hypothetical protein
MNSNFISPAGTARRMQAGITTLAITLILLVIVTVMVLFSTSIGFFEQKTATNENRARLSEQAAEYVLNLAGEYLKANRDKLISNTTGGWFSTGTPHWAKCSDVGVTDADFPAGHACLSERDTTASTTYPNGRRAALYFWTVDGTKGGSQLLPYTDVIPDDANLTKAAVGVGGTAKFATTANVRALLCRLDTSVATNVRCALTPVAGNRIAMTLIADAGLTDENGARASIKETWASYSNSLPSSAVPLVASGLVTGLGNGNIVANPDSQGNGSNLMASMWSPNNIDRGGSYISCQLSDFTGQLSGGAEWPMLKVKTDCPALAGTGPGAPPCNCPKSPNESLTMKEDWSGHGTGGGGTFHTGNDILDVSAGEPVCNSTINAITSNCRTLPSITFFPGPNKSGSAMDRAGVDNDDSVFEYVFGVSYVVPDRSTDGKTLQTCGGGAQNCFDYAMREDFNAVTVANCSSIPSSGIVYVTAPCGSIGGTIGSPDNPVIVVINQGSAKLSLGNDLIVYGMLFVHADDNNADVQGQNPQVYGSLVVEGDIKMTGKFLIVYDDTGVSSNTNVLPKTAKFGRVPGSWLDAKTAF